MARWHWVCLIWFGILAVGCGGDDDDGDGGSAAGTSGGGSGGSGGGSGATGTGGALSGDGICGAEDGQLFGKVLHVDRFGNLITNIPRDLIISEMQKRGATRVGFRVGEKWVRRLVRTFGQVDSGTPVGLFGSGGHLELAVNGGRADRVLAAESGSQVEVVLQ